MRGSRIGGKKLFDLGKVIEGFKKTRKGLHESNSVRERGGSESGRETRREEKKAENSGNGLAHVTSVKKKGVKGSERVGRPLLSRSPSVEAMIVSSCYTRRNGVIRSEKKEREV